MNGIDCLISGIDCLISGIDCLISGIDCLISGIDCLISGIDSLISGTDCLRNPELAESGLGAPGRPHPEILSPKSHTLGACRVWWDY